jgi:hypothetical protein
MNLRPNLFDGCRAPSEQPFHDKFGAQLNVLSTRRSITWRSSNTDLKPEGNKSTKFIPRTHLLTKQGRRVLCESRCRVYRVPYVPQSLGLEVILLGQSTCFNLATLMPSTSRFQLIARNDVGFKVCPMLSRITLYANAFGPGEFFWCRIA